MYVILKYRKLSKVTTLVTVRNVLAFEIQSVRNIYSTV